ncbi:MAG: hypothetical protein AAAB35_01415 [Phyllobacterium sp.]|uniref:hypothetical protein n=1 Tax=Phyllobacterium sp. TaxID=1871046 RepID=UPI0030F30631
MERLEIGNAAVCIGSTKQSIQKWLLKGQITLPDVRAEKGQRATFSAFNLCFLGLLNQFITYGVGVRAANSLAQSVFQDETLLLEPTDDLLAKVQNRWVYLTKTHGEWKVGVWQRVALDRPSTLVIDLTALFSDVLGRAAEIGKNKVA